MNIEKWFKKVGIKTIKTMAQTAVGLIGSSVLITDINWPTMLSAVLLSGLTCILMNVSQIKDEE